jgi:hypothetical protein
MTGINITPRIQVIMDSKVPTWGENPSLGPITLIRSSAEIGVAELALGIRDRPRVPDVMTVADLMKSLRVVGLEFFNVLRRNSYSKEC